MFAFWPRITSGSWYFKLSTAGACIILLFIQIVLDWLSCFSMRSYLNFMHWPIQKFVAWSSKSIAWPNIQFFFKNLHFFANQCIHRRGLFQIGNTILNCHMQYDLTTVLLGVSILESCTYWCNLASIDERVCNQDCSLCIRYLITSLKCW